MSDFRFPDSRMPTEQERQKLCKMLFHALLELRTLGNNGEAEQAAALADAFHNLPVYLWSDAFSFNVFRQFLESYHERYPERWSFNYLAMLDEIINGEERNADGSSANEREARITDES